MKKALVSNTPVGAFAFSESGEVVFSHFYSTSPEEAVKEFSAGFDFTKIKDYQPVEDSRFSRIKLRQITMKEKRFPSEKEFIRFISDFTAALSLQKLGGMVEKDRLLAQAVNAVAELSEMENASYTRLREWFSLYYPEEKSSGKELASRIKKYGARENFPGYSKSTGVMTGDKDVGMMKKYAMFSSETSETQKELESYVRSMAEEIMPTTCTIITPIIAARLLAHAGSLEKLARMTSSTIQLLGAEKALFRHLKKEGNSPKYGILFMDSRIQGSMKKGKVARIISSKLMMAVKIDFFSKRKEMSLLHEMEKELSSL